MNRSDVVYLLGAGASYDAGLPLSLQLTDKIGELIAKREPILSHPYMYNLKVGEMTQAYYATKAILQAGDAYEGRSPALGVDIERLFSAAQTLATASKLEIAPFIQAWREPFPVRPDPTEWRCFVEKILKHKNEEESTDYDYLKPPASDFSRVYARLCEEISEVLPKALALKSDDSHSYLLPILQAGRNVRVATLNYDLGVESAAKRAGLSVDTGISRWRGGLRWKWENEASDVHLLKLHGSLNWGRALGEAMHLPPGTAGIITKENEDLSEGILCETQLDQVTLQHPGLVFGLRNKLRPDGPFMAMLGEFWRWLESANRLVVIGYSFRDDHINHLIDDWIVLKQSAVLDIVDPTTPESRSKCRSDTPYFIRKALDYVKHEVPGCPEYNAEWSDCTPQFNFHRCGAAEWLSHSS